MLDHISFSVNNYAQSLKFYDETLEILGMIRLMNFFETEERQVAGYGSDGRPVFWMGVGETGKKPETVGNARGLHIAFRAPNVQAVNAWHKKCLELGGTDNGVPGPRPEYHPGYYGAFIVDPNGWRIEACLHTYEGS